MFFIVFFFNDTATTEIYTLSLHDALPISDLRLLPRAARRRDHAPRRDPARRALYPVCDRGAGGARSGPEEPDPGARRDRKSTRLNSSHANISYAVFCLKKKK